MSNSATTHSLLTQSLSISWFLHYISVHTQDFTDESSKFKNKLLWTKELDDNPKVKPPTRSFSSSFWLKIFNVDKGMETCIRAGLVWIELAPTGLNGT